MMPKLRRAVWLYAVALLAVTSIGLVLTGCSKGTVDTRENSAGTQVLKDVTTGEASDLIARNDGNLILLDVRTAAEFEAGHLEGAVYIDYYQPSFRSELDELDKNSTYLVYCRTARRSTDAMSIMGELGFQTVYNMLGGIERWTQEGRPVVK